MNWCGFPVGFRFAAKELTDTCKAECWKTVISAAGYADLRDMYLHEAEIDDPYADMKLYIAVIGSPNVGPLQKDAEMWRRDPALLGKLSFYRPFVQENYLELYAPTHKIGTFEENGVIHAAEGVGYLPERVIKSSFTRKTRRGIFLSRMNMKENMDTDYAAGMQLLSRNEPEFEVRRLNLTDGLHALYFAAAFRNGLLYKYPYKTETGEKKEIMYAILPGGRCLADGRELESDETGRTVLHALLRSICLWHGKGADVLLNGCDAFVCPEDCVAVTDIMDFYDVKNALEGTDAFFCLKTDKSYFESILTKNVNEL